MLLLQGKTGQNDEEKTCMEKDSKTVFLVKTRKVLLLVLKLFFCFLGSCNNPDCLFLHAKPEDTVKECPWYARGFCKHGNPFSFVEISVSPIFVA